MIDPGMQRHEPSIEDRRFLERFEIGAVTREEFNHRAHVRLAYICLAGSDTDAAAARMHQGLLGFLQHHGVPAAKYHETLTRAWILAVRHFMESAPDSASADAFIAHNPALLDSKIMLTHYSADRLFSDEARARFVEPDLEPIPRYEP
jgi:hypothetical protein